MKQHKKDLPSGRPFKFALAVEIVAKKHKIMYNIFRNLKTKGERK